MNRSERRRQAKLNRKNSGSTIKPFMIRGDFVDNQVVYDTSVLEHNQAKFVNGCVNSINDGIVERNETIDPADALTFVMYMGSEDFAGSFVNGLNCTPDDAWAEHKMMFDKEIASSPQVGFTYTRDEMVDMGTEMAGVIMDKLAEDGVWPWINANATFQKKGDTMVVIDTVEVA